jgi:dolichol-phosphate mannosyltransferase
MADNTLSVIIPTYNERENILPLVERLSRTLANYHYEIIFVDDNSKDGTVDVISDLSAKYPVKVLVRKSERGLATAVLHGLKFATGNIIGVMDADLQHPPEINAALLQAIEKGADMAVASRYVPGGAVPNWGLARRIISKGALTLAHLFLPSSRKVKDPMSGFFMFRGEKLAGLEFKPIGFKILLEMLVIGHFQNVVEVPFVFEDRSSGRSKMKASQQIDYLKHIFSLMRRKDELSRLLKFVGVGLCGVVVNQAVLSVITLLTKWNQDLAVLPGIEVSIITNFVLNDRITFSDRRTGQDNPFFIRLLKFNLVCLIGAAVNFGIYSLLLTAFGTDSIGIRLLANFIGIIAGFIWNYIFSLFWTWK